MDIAPKTSPKQNTIPFGLISPRSRPAKRTSRRVRRSTIEKPHSMFKQHKNTALNDYNHTIHRISQQQKSAFKPISVDSSDEPITKVLIWTKLIEFSNDNPSTEAAIGSWLSSGWYSPNDLHNKKRRDSAVYRSKMESHITCASLSQCLNYTFHQYMQYEWAQQVYRTLMTQLTLAQKALLFWMASQRQKTKNRTFIGGKEGVQWMIDHAMAHNRQEALTLAHQMIGASYLTSTSPHTASFEDNDSIIYQFYSDAIDEDLQTPRNVAPMDRLHRHNKLMRALVQMTVIGADDDEHLMGNVERAFYVEGSNRYVCRAIDYVAFDAWHEAIEFILTEFWKEAFAHNIYVLLLKRLSVWQQCKLMSIGVEVTTRKWRLKKYKACFMGCDAINWLISSRLVSDCASAMHFANRLCEKGFVKHIADETKPFRNDANSLYRFDFAVDEEERMAVVSKCFAHEEWIQHLISMSMSSDLSQLLLDLSRAFYLPRTAAADKQSLFVSKVDDDLVFENVIEALHYLLLQEWHQEYSQIVYRKLLNAVSVAHKAKLFSLGMERKTKTKHFRKYKQCIVGNEACEWLVEKGFCRDSTNAVQLGNVFYNRGFVKNMVQSDIDLCGEFKNGAILYEFCDIEINKQCIMESYNKQLDYDATEIDIQRTPPIKISQSKSSLNLVYGAQRVQRHHEMNNVSVYSNIAVNESITADTPEPHHDIDSMATRISMSSDVPMDDNIFGDLDDDDQELTVDHFTQISSSSSVLNSPFSLSYKKYIPQQIGV
eukprot:454893_1